MKTKIKKAFTLAEVLITLGIIGVVAAMTMPSLIADYQKKQTVTQLKKVYAELTQAFKMAEVENGMMDTWNFAYITNPEERGKFFGENYLLKNINIVNKCYPSSDLCWQTPKTLSGQVTLNNNTTAGRCSFTTTAGYSVYFWIHATGNGGWFYVDINGPKKGKNVLGKDVFIFMASFDKEVTTSGEVFNKIGIYPLGVSVDPPYTREQMMDGSTPQHAQFICSKNSSAPYAGGYCGTVIFADGWEIKDDYPW